jgi:beta-phosphoglucomutase
MIRAFLFDLDSVLTDTSEFHYLAWQRLANRLGLPFDRAANEALRGISRRDSLLRLLDGLTANEDQLSAWMDEKNQAYLGLVTQMTPANLLPGASTLLEELRQAGYRTAVASSSKNSALVIDRLGIASRLDVVVDGRAASSKPAPDLFLAAARQLGLEAPRCLVVEDAASGVEAAHRAGMRVVGLGPPERVGAAEQVFPSLAGLRLANFAPVLD